MKIAIDYSWFGPTGIGRVAEEVVRRTPKEWCIEEVRKGKPNAAPLTPLDLWRTIRNSSADLFWSPGFMPPIFDIGKPVVLTVHDLTHLHYYGKAKKLYYDALIKPLLRRTSHIATVSDFTRNELLAWSGISQERVTMIPNAVSQEFSVEGPRLQSDRKYLLYAGNRRSYKNVPLLMKAFSLSGLAKQGYMLGLTGARTPELEQIERTHGLEGHIRYFGFVPDDALPALYRSAHAVTFISLYEGFGLPILEAMASGVPVVTSNVTSMPEVAGGAALLVDPHVVDSVVAGLVEIAEDQNTRTGLIARGLQRASEYSWDKTANGYWQLFSRVLNKG